MRDGNKAQPVEAMMYYDGFSLPMRDGNNAKGWEDEYEEGFSLPMRDGNVG